MPEKVCLPQRTFLLAAAREDLSKVDHGADETTPKKKRKNTKRRKAAADDGAVLTPEERERRERQRQRQQEVMQVTPAHSVALPRHAAACKEPAAALRHCG